MAWLIPMGRIAKSCLELGFSTTLGLRTLSIKERPIEAYTGVISVSQRLDNDKLKKGTRTIHRRNLRWRANSRMMPAYEVTSLPPISMVRSLWAGKRMAAAR